MVKINIIGAGMAGLLAANILRRHDITIFEKQPSLPNNHHAVLRFRTPDIGHILGIPFKKVNMIKTHVPYRNLVADSLSYSRKVTGKYLSDRSIVAGTVQDERYIAPTNLIEQMAHGINIKYNSFEYDHSFPTISTIPMPALMEILDYPHKINFDSKSGVVFTGTILDCDAYVSVLFPGPEEHSRATITGNQLSIEFPNMLAVPKSMNLTSVYFDLGLYDATIINGEFKKQQYFKITAIDEAQRKQFMRWATVKYNVYSLGRYSTWRPKLLLDDLVQDVRKIEGWICK